MAPDRRPVTERRRSERYPLVLPVDYSAVDAFFTEFSANINEGGMFIETNDPAALGTVIELQFQLPGLDRPLEVSGTVAWLSDGKGESPAGMGVEFCELSEAAREAINSVVRNLRARR
jgi:uncharacterized protein (TIGR02266 family)